MVTDWPQPHQWHPDRAHLKPTASPAPPGPPPDLSDLPGLLAMLECSGLRLEQSAAIRGGMLRMDDALWLPCECYDCWTLFDSEEYDRQEDR